MIIRAMLFGNCTRLWLEDTRLGLRFRVGSFLVADCISKAWCRSHCSLFAMYFFMYSITVCSFLRSVVS